MQTMVHIWDGVSFHHQPYRETGVSILTALDEIQTMLDDQIVKTQTMRGSPFIKPFEIEIKVLENFFHSVQINNFPLKFSVVIPILPYQIRYFLTLCSVTSALGGASSSNPGNH